MVFNRSIHSVRRTSEIYFSSIRSNILPLGDSSSSKRKKSQLVKTVHKIYIYFSVYLRIFCTECVVCSSKETNISHICLKCVSAPKYKKVLFLIFGCTV